MKKIIIFIITAIITFGWFVTHYTTEPEKYLPASPPFIIKSNLPGTCRISAMGTIDDSKRSTSVIACRLKLYTDY